MGGHREASDQRGVLRVLREAKVHEPEPAHAWPGEDVPCDVALGGVNQCGCCLDERGYAKRSTRKGMLEGKRRGGGPETALNI